MFAAVLLLSAAAVARTEYSDFTMNDGEQQFFRWEQEYDTRTCEIRGQPLPIDVTSAPSHGRITSRTARQVKAHDTNCTVDATDIYYTPDRDYVGSDQTTISLIGRSGPDTVVTFLITVHGDTQETQQRPAAEVVGTEVLRQQTQQIIGIVGKRISSFIAPSPRISKRTKTSSLGESNQTPQTASAADVRDTSWIHSTERETDRYGRNSSGSRISDLLTASRFAGDLLRRSSERGAFSAAINGLNVASNGISYDLPTELLGLSAGDDGGNGGMGLGVWGNLSYTRIRNSLASTRFSGNLYTLMSGVDYSPVDGLVAGTAISYELVNLNMTYSDGKQNSRGFSVTPYAGYVIFDGDNGRLAADVLAGWGRASSDVSRNRSTTQISGDYDGTRWMAAGNINYYYLLDNWNFNAKLGYSWARQTSSAYTETNGLYNATTRTVLGQVQIGGKISYQFDIIEPYIGGTFMYDNVMSHQTAAAGQPQPSNDRSEIEGTVGVNLRPVDGIIGGVEASHGFFRRNQSSSTVLVHLRGEF